jgi:hypothetical protein
LARLSAQALLCFACHLHQQIACHDGAKTIIHHPNRHSNKYAINTKRLPAVAKLSKVAEKESWIRRAQLSRLFVGILSHVNVQTGLPIFYRPAGNKLTSIALNERHGIEAP